MPDIAACAGQKMCCAGGGFPLPHVYLNLTAVP